MPSALRSVVKHSYLTGKSQGVGRAKAHLRYIQFRAGKDKDEEPRSFFNNLRDDVTGRHVSESVSAQDPRGVVMHKLILSPGVQGADVKEYCREVMANLSSKKGLDLEWYAVQHDNTSNPHVHIVVMGKDQNGHRVKITRDDYTKIKETGDRYLERNRHLERDDKDRDKDQDKEQEKERNPVTRFVDALKAAAHEFSRSLEREAKGESKPESKFDKRRREKEEERQQELDALGENVDLDAYLEKEAKREEREEARKQMAWKAYCKPIEVDRGAHEPIKFDRSMSIETLRELERDYKNQDPKVREAMTDKDAERLNDWIKEKYRDEKRVEAKAEKLQSIDIELDAETPLNLSSSSSLEELRKLEDLNARGEVYLDDAERKALAKWMKDQEYKEPLRIEMELGADPVVYDQGDSKGSLQFLASAYERGEHWAAQNLSKEEYKRVKGWIADKDKGKDADKEREKERVSLGKGKDGEERFVSKSLDAEGLRQAREELSKSPDANKHDLKLLDSWISVKEREESKEPTKKAFTQRRKKSAREKLMDREVRQARLERRENYYKEKAAKWEHLQEQRAKVVRTDPMKRGAAATPANQLFNLFQQASKNHKENKEKKKDVVKPGSPEEKLQEKKEEIRQMEMNGKRAERFMKMDKDEALAILHFEKAELEKEVEAKKKEERFPEPRREKDRDENYER